MKPLKSGRETTYSRPLHRNLEGHSPSLPYSLFHPWLPAILLERCSSYLLNGWLLLAALRHELSTVKFQDNSMFQFPGFSSTTALSWPFQTLSCRSFQCVYEALMIWLELSTSRIPVSTTVASNMSCCCKLQDGVIFWYRLSWNAGRLFECCCSQTVWNCCSFVCSVFFFTLNICLRHLWNTWAVRWR